MLTSPAVLRLMTTIVLAGIAAGAQAGALTVTPVTVTLDGQTRSVALTVSNEGDQARVIQTELVRWTQKAGADQYTPSHDILVNPPLATLQPGQTQVVRIGLGRKADNTQELTYRLYLTEVPPPGEHVKGLRVVLRLSVPIYVSPQAKPSASLEWQAARAPKGLLLTLLNEGNRHVRVDSFSVVDPVTGRALGGWRRVFALLAGQARPFSLALPAGWPGRQLKMTTETADGPAETMIEVPRPAI